MVRAAQGGPHTGLGRRSESLAARARHAAGFDEVEGAEANASFQDFLEVVERLASERRLSRQAYLARKP